MKKSHVSYRISEAEEARIAALAKRLKTSEAEVVRLVLELAKWDEVEAIGKVRFSR